MKRFYLHYGSDHWTTGMMEGEKGEYVLYEDHAKEVDRLRSALEKMLKEDNGGDLSWQEIARQALADCGEK